VEAISLRTHTAARPRSRDESARVPVQSRYLACRVQPADIGKRVPSIAVTIAVSNCSRMSVSRLDAHWALSSPRGLTETSSDTVHVVVANSGIATDLLGVCVRSASEAVAVGRGGVIVRWDGERWAREPSPTEEDLYAICATPEGELVAVGGNLNVGGRSLVCCFAGGKWTVERSPVQSLLLSVAAERGCLRAVGFNGDLVERVDGVWRALAAPTNVHLFCIRSFGGAWLACGLDGTVVELNRANAQLKQAGLAHLTSVAAVGAVRVSVGFDGTIMRRDRGGWRTSVSPTREHLWSAMSDGARLAIAGAHGTLLVGTPDALALVPVPTREDLHAIDGVAGVAIAVGRHGTVVHVST
jgi:hypothetical protein